MPGSEEAYLLQDPTQPGRFFSFGSWESEGAISRWRSTPEFATFVAKVRELCDEFQPYTLHLAAHVGARAS